MAIQALARRMDRPGMDRFVATLISADIRTRLLHAVSCCFLTFAQAPDAQAANAMGKALGETADAIGKLGDSLATAGTPLRRG